MPGKKHVIAVSGGLGTGIDIVLGMLRRLGYQIEDADEIARCLTRKGSFGYQQIVERLGSQYLDSRGELDRAQLHRAAQTKPEIIQHVHSVLYPLVEEALRSLIESADDDLVFVKGNSLDAYGLRN